MNNKVIDSLKVLKSGKDFKITIAKQSGGTEEILVTVDEYIGILIDNVLEVINLIIL